MIDLQNEKSAFQFPQFFSLEKQSQRKQRRWKTGGQRIIPGKGNETETVATKSPHGPHLISCQN